jgi:hypothetical protein
MISPVSDRRCVWTYMKSFHSLTLSTKNQKSKGALEPGLHT